MLDMLQELGIQPHHLHVVGMTLEHGPVQIKLYTVR
jgi:hypothetical protein